MAPDIGHPFAEPDPALQAEDEELSAADITPSSPWWSARTLRRVWLVLLVGFGGTAAFLEYLGPPDDVRTTPEFAAGSAAVPGPAIPVVVTRSAVPQQPGVTEHAAIPTLGRGPVMATATSIAPLRISVPVLAPIPRAPASIDAGLPVLPPVAVGMPPPPPRGLPIAPSPPMALPDLTHSAGPAAPTLPPGVPIPLPPVASSETISATLVQTMLRRGDAMMDQGDISAARRTYERAAAAGNAQAATGVGRTYDPDVLAVLGAPRGMADRAAAIQWYRRGAAMGDLEAARLLQDLGAQRDN